MGKSKSGLASQSSVAGTRKGRQRQQRGCRHDSQIQMKEFARRHFPAALIAGIGIFMAIVLSGLLEPYQVSIGPEFILKVFAKLVYFAAALVLTHVAIRLIFPTIYCYVYTKAGMEKSGFMIDWAKGSGPAHFNPKIYVATFVHVGTFAAVCLLLALAF